jgi:hypothetical protein
MPPPFPRCLIQPWASRCRKFVRFGNSLFNSEMHPRHRLAITLLYQGTIPSMVWAEDAIRRFGCRIMVSHLFLLVPEPAMAYDSRGKYIEPHNSICYDVDELLGDAPCLLPLEGDHHPVALLGASDWMTISPLALAPDPQFPSLDILLSSLLTTWLQRPYTSSSFCLRLAAWIVSSYEARGDDALKPPIESDAQHYLALCRAIPPRLRQLHVDLVFGRVFFSWQLAHMHTTPPSQKKSISA